MYTIALNFVKRNMYANQLNFAKINVFDCLGSEMDKKLTFCSYSWNLEVGPVRAFLSLEAM